MDGATSPFAACAKLPPMREIAAGRAGRKDLRQLLYRELPDRIVLVDVDRQAGGHPRRRQRSVGDLDGDRLTTHDVSVEGLFEPVGLTSERTNQGDAVRKSCDVDGVALAVIVDSEFRTRVRSREERIEALERDSNAAVARDDVHRAVGQEISGIFWRCRRLGFVRG